MILGGARGVTKMGYSNEGLVPFLHDMSLLPHPHTEICGLWIPGLVRFWKLYPSVPRTTQGSLLAAAVHVLVPFGSGSSEHCYVP